MERSSKGDLISRPLVRSVLEMRQKFFQLAPNKTSYINYVRNYDVCMHIQ